MHHNMKVYAFEFDDNHRKHDAWHVQDHFQVNVVSGGKVIRFDLCFLRAG